MENVEKQADVCCSEADEWQRHARLRHFNPFYKTQRRKQLQLAWPVSAVQWYEQRNLCWLRVKNKFHCTDFKSQAPHENRSVSQKLGIFDTKAFFVVPGIELPAVMSASTDKMCTGDRVILLLFQSYCETPLIVNLKLSNRTPGEKEHFEAGTHEQPKDSISRSIRHQRIRSRVLRCHCVWLSSTGRQMTRDEQQMSRATRPKQSWCNLKIHCSLPWWYYSIKAPQIFIQFDLDFDFLIYTFIGEAIQTASQRRTGMLMNDKRSGPLQSGSQTESGREIPFWTDSINDFTLKSFPFYFWMKNQQ